MLPKPISSNGDAHMRLLRAVGLSIGLAIMPASAAVDHPSVGITSGAIDKDFIQYKCDRPVQAGMVCKFTQLKMRVQAKPEGLDEKLSRIAELEKQIRDNPTKHNAQCKDVGQMEKVLRSGPTPNDQTRAEFDQTFEDLHPKEKQDMLNVIALLGKVCEAPTRENIAAMVRAEHEKDTRTCSIMTRNFEQTFQPTAVGTWVHTSALEGECGIIYITSFEKADPKFSLWNYRTRRVVTNKQGSCAGYDETEQTYNWRSEMFFKGCDYIRYGF